MLSLSAAAFAQEEDDGEGSVFVEPNQSMIDSLLNTIRPDSHDSVKADRYCQIAKLTINYPSKIEYARKSLAYCDSSDVRSLAYNYNSIGCAYYMLDEPDSALPLYRKSAEYFAKMSETLGEGNQYINIGACYEDLNMQDSILYYYNKALAMFIDVQDNTNISYAYQRLALIYSNLGLYETAIEYYQKGLQYANAADKPLEIAGCYFGIGEVYSLKSDSLYSQSINYLKVAAEIFEAVPTDDIYFISNKYDTYSALAAAYINGASVTGEKKYADSSYMYIKKIGSFYIDQGNFQTHVATQYAYVKYLTHYQQYHKALDVLLGLEEYLDESPYSWKNYHQRLYKIYTLLGDYKNAVLHLEKYNEYRFSTLNDSTLNTLKDAEISRTRIIEELKRENIEKSHALETARLNSDRNRMFGVIIALLVVSLLIVRMLWIKKTAYKILTEKNNILNSQKAQIETQRDEIIAQKDIITVQWREVETVNNKLISSINYAERIQRAAVSKIEEVKAIFPESFVLYQPRDIVSGDFYRCGRCGKYAVMITADCTGHGIPGAFLSMLGLSGLKEYMVTEYDAANPGTVLDRMRTFIKTTLVSSQKGKIIDDGMDMTICCYDFDQMELRYAIAGQTAFIIRDGEAIKLKGDIMPVGHYVREKEHFKTLSTPIRKGDMVYSFSDGIQDQLGGPEQRKYLQNNLLELLKGIVSKPADEQMEIIRQKIRDWRGDNPQVDDMTLVGIRV